MKKNVIATALVATAVFCSTAMAVAAADGTVNFTGKISDNVCKVDFGGGSTALTVNLGEVARTSFSAGVGATSSATKFTLKLSDCPATATTAKVKFDGVADGVNPQVLAVDAATGAATGVAVQLSDAPNGVLPLYTASKAFPLQASPVVNDLDFYARYIATKAAVTAGPANSTATFTVNYN
ncbi:MAG: fimbrial protein [Serratia inhibens]|uniref:fimbrial protein n=1 Tax=Serratia inhibens TaxID=2338073 RepID=UPI003C7D3029